jgi:hypothetical protein
MAWAQMEVFWGWQILPNQRGLEKGRDASYDIFREA